MKKKTVALLMSLVLIFGVAVGGTIAWLMDTTDPVVNTFTVGDIEITLEEDEGTPQEDGSHQFKVIPGTPITKDPEVTVLAGSEKCWLFVTIDKTNWPEDSTTGDDLLTYGIAAGWTELQTGVYYRIVEATTADTPFDVLLNNTINVSEDTDADEMDDMSTNVPKLTFKAYAIQYENFEPTAETPEAIKTAAAKAWEEVSP